MRIPLVSETCPYEKGVFGDSEPKMALPLLGFDVSWIFGSKYEVGFCEVLVRLNYPDASFLF